MLDLGLAILAKVGLRTLVKGGKSWGRASFVWLLGPGFAGRRFPGGSTARRGVGNRRSAEFFFFFLLCVCVRSEISAEATSPGSEASDVSVWAPRRVVRAQEHSLNL